MTPKYKKVLALEILSVFSIALFSASLSVIPLLHNLLIYGQEKMAVSELYNSIKLKRDSVNVLSQPFHNKRKKQANLGDFDRNSIVPIDLVYPQAKAVVDPQTRLNVDGIAQFLNSIGKNGDSYAKSFYSAELKGGEYARKGEIALPKFIDKAWDHKMITGEGNVLVLPSLSEKAYVIRRHEVALWNRLTQAAHADDFEYIYYNLWPPATLKFMASTYNVFNPQDFIRFIDSNTITHREIENYKKAVGINKEIEGEKVLISQAHEKAKNSAHSQENIISFCVTAFIILLIVVYIIKIIRWSLKTIYG